MQHKLKISWSKAGENIQYYYLTFFYWQKPRLQYRPRHNLEYFIMTHCIWQWVSPSICTCVCLNDWWYGDLIRTEFKLLGLYCTMCWSESQDKSLIVVTKLLAGSGPKTSRPVLQINGYWRFFLWGEVDNLSPTSAEVRKHEAVPATSYFVFMVRHLIKHKFLSQCTKLT